MNIKRPSIIVSLLIALSLAACGGAAATPQAPDGISAPQPTVVVKEAPSVNEAGDGNFLPLVNQMIIKDAQLELLVPDVEMAVRQITQLASDNGGYLISSQTWLVGDVRNATLQIGVPSSRFEIALNILRSLADKVLKETTSGQDVSAEYTDLQSRLINLEATAARVREFLADAKTVEESLRINGELSILEGQVEQVKGQMRFYEGRSAISTMTVVLTQPTPLVVVPPAPGWNPAHTFGRALEVVTQLAQVGLDVLIWLLTLGGPFLLVGAVALVFIRRAFRKRA